MEEDIKILEDFIKYCEAKVISKKNNRAFGICIYEDDIQALENLLKGYRKLEEELKREKKWRIRLEKENEDTCNEVNNNYIRKSLVIPKSKIKEILDRLKISDIEPWSTYEVNGEILFDLEKLLGE